MTFDKEKLIDMRWDRRLSQSQVARGIGVKPPVVWSWEHGRHVPSMPMIFKLASFFNVGPDSFFIQDLSLKKDLM